MPGRRDIEAGGAFVRLFLKNDMTKDLVKSLHGAGNMVQGFGMRVGAMGAGIAAAGSAIVAPLVGAVHQFADVGDALDKMSARTGIAAPALAELGFAAEQSGASLENVENAVLRMNRRIGRITVGMGSKEQVKALQMLGLSAQQLDKMNPEEQLLAIADAMSQHGDAASAAGLAQRAFGTAVDKILPLLALGREGIQKLRDEAKDLNIVPSDEEVANAAKVTDALNRVRRVLKSTIFTVGAKLAEPILAGLEAVKNIVVAISKWVDENQQLIRVVAGVGAALLGVGTAVTALGAGIVGVGLVISSLGTVLAALGTAIGLVLSPVGLIVAGLVAGVAAWIRFTDAGKAAVGALSGLFGGLLDTAKRTFGAIFDAVVSGDFARAKEIAVAGWKSAVARLKIEFAKLKLLAAEGLLALQSIIGETATGIIGRLASGDFAGAWSDTLSQLSLLWATFSEGVINTMTSVADAITNVWRDAVTYITKQILRLANNPVFAKAFEKYTGVDLVKEQARGEETQQQQREMVTRRIENLTQQRQEAEANLELATRHEETSTKPILDEIAKIDKQLEDATGGERERLLTQRVQFETRLEHQQSPRREIEAELAWIDQELADAAAFGAELALPFDIVAEAGSVAEGNIAAQAESIKNKLDEINAAAAARTDEAAKGAADSTADGMEAIREAARMAREEIDRLTGDLDKADADLRKKTARERKDEAKKGPAAAPGPEGAEGPVAAKGKLVTPDLVTTHAAAAVAAGYGTGRTIEQRMAGDIRELKKLTDKQLQEQAAMTHAFTMFAMGFVHG
jgi:hypothetical protein